MYGCYEAVVWLLDNGADPNGRNDYGSTPMHFAGGKEEGGGEGGREIFYVLKERGGTVDIRGRSGLWEGEKDVGGAREEQRVKGGMGSTRLKLIGSLIAFGDLLYSPLITSSRDGDVQGVKKWIAENATPESDGSVLCGVDGPEDWEGSTALCHAASGGSLEVVKILVEAGADLSSPREPRANALHYSCFKMHKGVFSYLLSLPGGKEAARRRGESQLWGSMGAVTAGELAEWNAREAERFVCMLGED